ncbi:MAG: nucleotidyltransferase domain-containing protein [Candidatus Diapherotrites archaeon]|nr:nucleotidyltransferase domain-containing protein [Candidatus Diapherotrites archaeon]
METLFGSSLKTRLLEFLFAEPNKEIKVRETARKLKISPAVVSKTLFELEKKGFVSGKKIGLSNPETRAVKTLFNVSKLSHIGLVKKIRKTFPKCSGIGVFGSWQTGTNHPDSDIDLWVKTEENADDEKIIPLRIFIGEKTGSEANLLVLSKKRAREMKEKDFVFYCSLAGSLVLWGETLD